jgi:hypothetical protein
MKRVFISIFALLLLVSLSVTPVFAGLDQISDVLTVQRELVNPDSEEPGTTRTDYVAELNKIGIAGRPESDNAAPYYEKAIELYVKSEYSRALRGSWPKELPAKQHAMLKKWVQDNNRALEQIQLGSKKTYCWFKLTGKTLHQPEHQNEMPDLSTKRDLAFALRARAMLSAEDGNINAAIDDIETLYIYGAHVAEGPKHLIEKLVGIAIKTLPIRIAFDLLDKKMVNTGMMKSLEDGFKQLVTEYSEPFDIRGEKFYLQEQIETDPKYRFFKPYLKGTLDYYDVIASKTAWQLHNEPTQSVIEKNPLIETAGSGIPNVIELESRIRADEHALITTMAVLRYNADKGGYPANFSDIVSSGYIKELPIDPFSDKPFVYKQTRDNFTLYSFGADYDDDGGMPSKWGRGEEGGDQVFWPVEAAGGAQTEVAELKTPAEPVQQKPPVRRRLLTGSALEEANNSLFQAVVTGNIDEVKSLIANGADINAENRMRWTPLHTAIRNRRQEIVGLLIAEGADVNKTDNRGMTPLHVAVDTGQKEVVELLIPKVADINVMGSRGENALSLAQRRRNTELVDLLVKHGAKEPSPEDLMGDRYYGGANPYPGYEEQATPQRRTIRRGGQTTRTFTQTPAQVDILADPNEIKARIKTFAGLEKILAEVADKSENEVRQWEQKRYDNRSLLLRSVQKQFEDEMGLIRTTAVEEKAKKTTETIDSVLSGRQGRLKSVSKELLVQRREQRQMESTRGRGRTRSTGRSSRGRTSQRGQQYGSDMTDPYGGRSDTMSRTTRSQSTRRPSEQVDMETENEINQWLQASFEDKTNLADAVHQQLRLEIESVRGVAVEEQAKKTTAAIDGVLLYRQMRFEAYISKMEEEEQALRQQTQDPSIRGRTSGRRSMQGGRTRGGTGTQGDYMDQQNQPRGRTRRR